MTVSSSACKVRLVQIHVYALSSSVWNATSIRDLPWPINFKFVCNFTAYHIVLIIVVIESGYQICSQILTSNLGEEMCRLAAQLFPEGVVALSGYLQSPS